MRRWFGNEHINGHKGLHGGKWTQKSATEENGRKDLYEGKWTQRSATAENGRKSLHGGISDGLRIGGKDDPAGQVPAF